ncbi:MAG: hypothetical protein RR292_05270 [Christensenellaceae bacterium]
MKKLCMILVCILFVSTLCACSLSATEKYFNAITDLDVVTRLEIAFNKVSNNKGTAYAHADMQTLQEDLSAIKIPDETTKIINDYYKSAASFLCQSIQAKNKKDTQNTAYYLELAVEQYHQAQKLLNAVRTGSTDDV